MTSNFREATTIERRALRGTRLFAVGALLATVAGWLVSGASASGRDAPSPSASTGWYAWTHQPPPPALRPHFDAFLPIYLSYTAFADSTRKPSFSRWLIMNRVVDPTTHQAMLMLYVWAERFPQPAQD